MEVSIAEKQHAERISALGATYQHLATKDDISRLRLELEKSVNRLEVELEKSVNKLQANTDALKWVITLAIGSAAIVLAAIQVIVALALRS